MNPLVDRMIRAAKLDANLYEEVEADTSALGQAILVVVLSSIAGGLGTLSIVGFKGVLTAVVVALVGWIAWALVTYFIGTKILPQPQTNADFGQLLRTIGFSSSPGIIRILGVIPFLYSVTSLVASIWMLIAMVVAVRQALDYDSTWRAVGVCLLGWVVYLVIALIFAALAK
jgi:Yip1 domain